MPSMLKSWKYDASDFIRRSVDPSLDEDTNYDMFLRDYDEDQQGFIDDDYGSLTKEEVLELGGSTKLANLMDDFDDLSNEKQNKIYDKIQELVLEFSDCCKDNEEEWIRRKISKLLKTA